MYPKLTKFQGYKMVTTQLLMNNIANKTQLRNQYYKLFYIKFNLKTLWLLIRKYVFFSADNLYVKKYKNFSALHVKGSNPAGIN